MSHYLVTGGAGFIGSHLSEALLAQGQQVTVIDNLSTGRFDNIAHLTDHPSFHFAIDTITNEVVMDRLVSECDRVVHLAAAVGVELIIKDPVHVIETNILGTRAVLNVASRYRKKVLLASTSEIYGKSERVPFGEDDDRVIGSSTKARWSYSTSKAVDEFLGLAYHRQVGLPVVVFRLFNTIGPRQTGRYGMVVPRFVSQALAGESLTVYGDGSQTRCFLHVGDAVEAIITLAESSQAVGEVFNVGSTDEISILALARKILTMVDAVCPDQIQGARRSYAGKGGQQERIALVPYEEAYETGFEDMLRRVPDTTKIQRLVGWRQRRTLDETLKDVIRSLSAEPARPLPDDGSGAFGEQG
ncbi:GDP-mannose 4,6-dehydratase [Chloroflexota bacterium]